MNLTWHSTLGVSWPFKKHLQKYFLLKIRWVEKQIKFRKSAIWHIFKIHYFSVFSNYSNLEFLLISKIHISYVSDLICVLEIIYFHTFVFLLSLSKKWFHRFFYRVYQITLKKKLHTDLKKIILPKNMLYYMRDLAIFF